MSTYETIIYEKKAKVAWITLHRPEFLNAMNDDMRKELINVIEDAREDDAIQIITITGSGEKAFCAGADVGEFIKLSVTDQLRRRWKKHPIDLIREIPKPVIAMVNGAALGGGCELVLACDLVIAAESAQFGQGEIRVGLIPGRGGTQVLPRLIGEKRAKELIFTGRFIYSSEALQLGMINQAVPYDKLKETTESLIANLLKRSPMMLKLAKIAINRSLDTTLSSGLACEGELFALCFGTEDQKEGARAFVEKRKPSYKGS